MKISDSSLQFQSTHTSTRQYQETESLNIQWEQPGEIHDQVDISSRARQTSISAQTDPDTILSLQERLISSLFERMFGKKIRLIIPSTSQALQRQQPLSLPTSQQTASATSQQQQTNWDITYERSVSYSETESLQFSAEGIVHTEDGQELQIEVALSMSREFYSTQYERISVSNVLKDPLVINYTGNAAELTETTFSFDIDADGSADQISSLASGSGFLALDSNNDGVINDGSELFGAESGDGFADLSAYDEDGNGWIDENDSVFEKLRIWVKDEAGNDKLFALGEKGIGALYLGNIASSFSLKDSGNTLQGEIRSTGIFLFENGNAGTMQQIDLVT